MTEIIWRDVVGYEGLYQVNNIGQVKSLDRPMFVNGFHRNPIRTIRKGKILSPRLSHDGYEKVSLTKDGKPKNYFVHRLVALAFIEQRNDDNEVNHIDGNKRNNCVDNLEWCSHRQNMQHCFEHALRKQSGKPMLGKTYGKSPLSKQVYQYDKENNLIKIWSSVREAAEHYNISGGNISKCCNGHVSSCKGFIWRYQTNNNYRGEN